MTRSDREQHVPFVFVCAALCFAAIHIPVDKMKELFGVDPTTGGLIRGLAFTTAVLPLMLVVGRALVRVRAGRLWDVRLFALTAIVFALLAALVVPDELRSQGVDYAGMSLDPFALPYGWFHRRVFYPFLAHILGWRGRALFLAFSYVFSFALLYLIAAFLFGRRRSASVLGSDESVIGPLPQPDAAGWSWPDKALLLASVGTSSFFIFNFQFPGYVDPPVFIGLLLLMLLPLRPNEMRAVSVLMLATTEAACWPLFVLYLFYFDRRQRLGNLLLLVIYGVLWLGVMKFDVGEVFSRHTTVGKPGLQLLVENVPRLVVGVLLAYKLLWLVPISAWLSRGGASVRQRFWLTVTLLFPFTMIPLVDTSRLIGWGFVGFLYFLAQLIAVERRPWARSVGRVVLVLNLLIPSLYCGTNTGIITAPGLYQRLARSLGLAQ